MITIYNKSRARIRTSDVNNRSTDGIFNKAPGLHRRSKCNVNKMYIINQEEHLYPIVYLSCFTSKTGSRYASHLLRTI